MKKLLTMVLVWCTAFGQPTNQLQKIFVHALSDIQKNQSAGSQEPSISLELSKVVLYFLQEPVILPTTQEKSFQGKKLVTYLFPKTELSSEAQDMLYKCNNQTNTHYSCTIKSVSKPVPSIEVTLMYDPAKVVYQYDTFQSMSNQKAIVFTFFDKQLIDRLRDMRTTILQTACHDAHQPRLIMLDCGHGGADSGAVGEHATVEKHITLQVGQQLAQEMKKRGWQVAMTRETDRFLALDERTALTNQLRPDLFISLHANACPNKQAEGIETFFFDRGCLKHKGHSDQYQLSFVKEVSDNARARSFALAQAVHTRVVAAAQQQRPAIDRKVKSGTAQVLLGSAVPAILLELGFLSHKQEAAALKSIGYQQALIEGICAGVADYFEGKSVG